MSALFRDDGRIIRLLELAPLERRPSGWRFGTKRVADHIVERLVAAGFAVRDGDRVRIAERQR